MSRPSRVLLVFLDGVGVGPDDAEVNPFVHAADRLPTLVRSMGDDVPTLERPLVSGPSGLSFPLAATLDVEGTPQSGTGQVALLTGENAAELFGGHFGPWTPVRLRPLLEERSVLRLAADAGRTVAFANAYPRGWPGPAGGRRLAGPPLAARAAGLLDRHEEALGRGEAVASEILNDGWRRHLGHASLPEVTAKQAGTNLARIAGDADLTLFAHYATDSAGHAQDMDRAVAALERVDAFLEGVLSALDPDTLLLVASDHGNLEDVRTGHTRNPALGMAVGPGAEAAEGLRDLRDVTPFVLRMLGVGE
ncbi:MAG: peptidase [Gemmatimonadetes bacterium]|nr:peptidase [Gemmatimonadota bacterium]